MFLNNVLYDLDYCIFGRNARNVNPPQPFFLTISYIYLLAASWNYELQYMIQWKCPRTLAWSHTVPFIQSKKCLYLPWEPWVHICRWYSVWLRIDKCLFPTLKTSVWHKIFISNCFLSLAMWKRMLHNI